MTVWPEGRMEFVCTAPAKEGGREQRWLGEARVKNHSMGLAVKNTGQLYAKCQSGELCGKQGQFHKLEENRSSGISRAAFLYELYMDVEQFPALIREDGD